MSGEDEHGDGDTPPGESSQQGLQEAAIAGAPDKPKPSKASAFLLNPKGGLPFLPGRLAELLHLPSRVRPVDPQFSRHSHRYLFQAGLAAVGMFAVLLFVDSLSDAALAAGLGASVLIVFVHPSSHAAQPRCLIGRHALAILVGSAFSLILFAAPVASFLENLGPVRDLSLALSAGVLILVMAVTDTEHPLAAGTVLGMSTRNWEPSTTAIIITAVLLLAVIKRLMSPYLRDLI